MVFSEHKSITSIHMGRSVYEQVNVGFTYFAEHSPLRESSLPIVILKVSSYATRSKVPLSESAFLYEGL